MGLAVLAAFDLPNKPVQPKPDSRGVSFIRLVYSSTPKRSWAFFMMIFLQGFVRFGIKATIVTLMSPKLNSLNNALN